MPNALQNFDWVALMAMPYMENASHPMKWLEELVAKTTSNPNSKNKIVYELQARDWKTGKPISDKELNDWMKILRIKGAINFGYYPDDPMANQPNVDIIKRELSTKANVQ